MELGSLLFVHLDSALAASSGLTGEERAAFAGQARHMLVGNAGRGGEVRARGIPGAVQGFRFIGGCSPWDCCTSLTFG